jgi:excisionase family DNA binding protein
MQETPLQRRRRKGHCGLYSHSDESFLGMRPPCERLLLTLPETAKALSVATRTVRRLIDRGELPQVKVGRCVRVPVEAAAGVGG